MIPSAPVLALAPVVADAGYGASTEFRDALSERGLSYAVGILADSSVWPPGQEPLPPLPRQGRGRARTRLRRTPQHQPTTVRELAQRLPHAAWKTIRWREGTKGTMMSRFAQVRVRAAHRDYLRTQSRHAEWLLVEWPSGDKEPSRYWLSTVPEDVELEELMRLAKIRWRIERDFQELKDELGLDHYQGRGWRGFHHHGALCIAAYASWRPSELGFPPQHLLPSSPCIAYPKIPGLAVRRRPERHNPASIATTRWRHARILAACLPHCPRCGHLEAG